MTKRGSVRTRATASASRPPATPRAAEPAAPEWFAIEGRPMGLLPVTASSGLPVRLPLLNRFAPEIAALVGRLAPDVLVAHACALSACALIHELAERWPHGDFAGNAERDGAEFIVCAAALRHVVRLIERDADKERLQRTVTGARFPDLPALHPVCDWSRFVAPMPVVALSAPAAVHFSSPSDQGISAHHASHHLAVRAVAGDIDSHLTYLFQVAGLLHGPNHVAPPIDDRPQNALFEDTWPSRWDLCLSRAGNALPRLLRQVWEESRNLLKAFAAADRSARSSVWPRDYWPAWRGMQGLLRAEAANVRPEAAEMRADDARTVSFKEAVEGRTDLGLPATPSGTLYRWLQAEDAPKLLGVRRGIRPDAQRLLVTGLVALHKGSRRGAKPPPRRK